MKQMLGAKRGAECWTTCDDPNVGQRLLKFKVMELKAGIDEYEADDTRLES